ncbi:MAG: hypothetical protein PF482_16330 [Desulfobacteraceae bacterium]|jgi:hypothetical protein|nr:hypothetical protein [Desulfobacteraceae bacterium]
MTLQYQIDSIEGLDAAIQPLYVEKDGKFVLDVAGHDKPDDKDKIPLSRLNQEIEKRKLSDNQLKEIADGFIESVPEEMRDLVPDLPHGQKIKWIQNAAKKGLFNQKNSDGIDTKRPSGKPPADFKNMSPQAIMAKGYKTK